jgi:23S rRNA pseudouridine2605 synthase
MDNEKSSDQNERRRERKPRPSSQSASGKEDNNRPEGSGNTERPYRREHNTGDYRNSRNDNSTRSDRPYNRDNQSRSDRPYNRDNQSHGDRPYNRDSQSHGDRPYNRDSQSGDRPYRRSTPSGSGRPYNSDRNNNSDRSYNGESKNSADGSPRGDRLNRGSYSKGSDRPYSSNRSCHSDRPYNSDRPYSSDRSFKREGGYKDNQPYKGKYPRKKIFVKPFPEEKIDDDGRIRLNKYISTSGLCSRREADKLIAAGLVTVNGALVTELGTKVVPEDDVRYNGERLKREERKVYILMNKPKEYVTTTDDPNADKTVMDLIRESCKERVYPIGRLDKMTTGVLLLTNDGELAKRLTHPTYNKKKVYHVQIDQPITRNDYQQLIDGVKLEDGVAKADAVSFVDDSDKKELGIELHSGRNRVIRRMFEALGYKVTKLDRVYFAGLTKKGLRRGHWRFLEEAEVNMLMRNNFQ